MTREFDKKFADLINHSIPRRFIQNPYDDDSDIPTEYPTLEDGKLPRPPANGFIATYCCEDGK